MLKNQTVTNLKLSKAHENHVVTILSALYRGVHRQPGSGNQATAPNDVIAPGQCYVECKATNSQSITIKRDWLERVRKLAVQGALRAILSIRFGYPFPKTYYVIDEDTLLHLLQCENELDAMLKIRQEEGAPVERTKCAGG